MAALTFSSKKPARNGVRVWATFAAYLRIDVIEDTMFPGTTAIRYLGVFVPVFMYFFQAHFLNAEAKFASTLIGVSTAVALQESLTGLTGRLQMAQERGTLETYLVEPVPWRYIPVAMNVWRTFVGVLMTCLMLTTGWLLGAPLNAGGLPMFLLVLLLGVAVCNAVGTAAASFLVLFKRGEPVIMLYGLGAAFAGGALFPITVLPAWLRFFSYLIPHTYVISAGRDLLLPKGAQTASGISMSTSLTCLIVFCVVGFAVGLPLFDRSLRKARRLGILST